MSHDRLNPKIDFMFRKLFGSEENKDLLISLINSVLGSGTDPKPPIIDVTLKNPFNLAAYQEAKETILDIRAMDQNGTWYDIEMQVESHSLYGRRAVYYLSKTYSDQLYKSEDYSHLNTVIGIHFLDFKYFADDRVLRRFVFKDAETNDAPKQLDCMQLYFIELPKFGKDWAELETAFDRWVAFFNRGEDVDTDAVPEQLAQDPAVARALVELDRAGLSPAERDVYEGEAKKKMIDAVQIRDAKLEGKLEGLQEGKLEGLQEGKLEGLQEGKLEGLQEGLLRSLQRQMVRRLGETPPSMSARMQRLNAETLDRLDLALPDLHTYADVEQWLERN